MLVTPIGLQTFRPLKRNEVPSAVPAEARAAAATKIQRWVRTRVAKNVNNVNLDSFSIKTTSAEGNSCGLHAALGEADGDTNVVVLESHLGKRIELCEFVYQLFTQDKFSKSEASVKLWVEHAIVAKLDQIKFNRSANPNRSVKPDFMCDEMFKALSKYIENDKKRDGELNVLKNSLASALLSNNDNTEFFWAKCTEQNDSIDRKRYKDEKDIILALNTLGDKTLTKVLSFLVVNSTIRTKLESYLDKSLENLEDISNLTEEIVKKNIFYNEINAEDYPLQHDEVAALFAVNQLFSEERAKAKGDDGFALNSLVVLTGDKKKIVYDFSEEASKSDDDSKLSARYIYHEGEGKGFHYSRMEKLTANPKVQGAAEEATPSAGLVKAAAAGETGGVDAAEEKTTITSNEERKNIQQKIAKVLSLRNKKEVIAKKIEEIESKIQMDSVERTDFEHIELRKEYIDANILLARVEDRNNNGNIDEKYDWQEKGSIFPASFCSIDGSRIYGDFTQEQVPKKYINETAKESVIGVYTISQGSELFSLTDRLDMQTEMGGDFAQTIKTKIKNNLEKLKTYAQIQKKMKDSRSGFHKVIHEQQKAIFFEQLELLGYNLINPLIESYFNIDYMLNGFFNNEQYDKFHEILENLQASSPEIDSHYNTIVKHSEKGDPVFQDPNKYIVKLDQTDTEQLKKYIDTTHGTCHQWIGGSFRDIGSDRNFTRLQEMADLRKFAPYVSNNVLRNMYNQTVVNNEKHLFSFLQVTNDIEANLGKKFVTNEQLMCFQVPSITIPPNHIETHRELIERLYEEKLINEKLQLKVHGKNINDYLERVGQDLNISNELKNSCNVFLDQHLVPNIPVAAIPDGLLVRKSMFNELDFTQLINTLKHLKEIKDKYDVDIPVYWYHDTDMSAGFSKSKIEDIKLPPQTTYYQYFIEQMKEAENIVHQQNEKEMLESKIICNLKDLFNVAAVLTDFKDKWGLTDFLKEVKKIVGSEIVLELEKNSLFTGPKSHNKNVCNLLEKLKNDLIDLMHQQKLDLTDEFIRQTKAQLEKSISSIKDNIFSKQGYDLKYLKSNEYDEYEQKIYYDVAATTINFSSVPAVMWTNKSYVRYLLDISMLQDKEYQSVVNLLERNNSDLLKDRHILHEILAAAPEFINDLFSIDENILIDIYVLSGVCRHDFEENEYFEKDPVFYGKNNTLNYIMKKLFSPKNPMGEKNQETFKKQILKEKNIDAFQYKKEIINCFEQFLKGDFLFDKIKEIVTGDQFQLNKIFDQFIEESTSELKKLSTIKEKDLERNVEEEKVKFIDTLVQVLAEKKKKLEDRVCFELFEKHLNSVESATSSRVTDKLTNEIENGKFELIFKLEKINELRDQLIKYKSEEPRIATAQQSEISEPEIQEQQLDVEYDETSELVTQISNDLKDEDGQWNLCVTFGNFRDYKERKLIPIQTIKEQFISIIETLALKQSRKVNKEVIDIILNTS